MQWISKWFRASCRQDRSPRVRPQVEALGERNLLNVSSVFDAAGQLHTLVVQQGGGLILYENGTAQQLATSGVRVAHAYRDSQGKLGMDIVYSNGNAYEYDSTHVLTLGTGNVLDAGHAIDRFGNFKLDILFANAAPPFGPDLTGTLVENTAAGARIVATNVRWVNVYVDTLGGIGTAMGVITPAGNLFASRVDSTGSYLLYNSPDGATQDLTDYSQTVFFAEQTKKSKGHHGRHHHNKAQTSAQPVPSKIQVEVTFGRFAGTYALTTTPNGVFAQGSGTDIQVGG